MIFVQKLDMRCQRILNRILYAGGYIKIQDIADEMKISRRTAYYDVNKINEWLAFQNIGPLLQERGKGILVNSTQVRKIQEIFVDTQKEYYHVITPEERNRIIICSITVREQPLYIENFMEMCDVSRNTIINDFKKVTNFLKAYNLRLSYDIKSGYRISGDIIKKRAVFFMLFPSLWEYYERGIIKTENETYICEVLAKLKQIELELHEEYVSGVLPALAVFLSSIENRNDVLNFTGMDEDEILETREYHLADKYFPKLKNSEKLYISLHLLGSRLQTIPVNVMKDEQGATYDIAKSLVHEFKQISFIYFEREDELIDAINTHLKTSLYRYRYGIQLGNPMLSSIMTEYADLFSMTKKSCSFLKKKLGYVISDAEVAYITLHFGAYLTMNSIHKKNLRILIICPNGIGTGNMLRNEVASLIPQAIEIRNLPLSQYEKSLDYDIVISTVVLPADKKLIVVNPILTDQDCVNILRHCMHSEPENIIQIKEIMKLAENYISAEALHSFERDLQEYYSNVKIHKVHHRSYGAGLSHYLKSPHIQIKEQACSWEEAIRFSCEPLLQSNSITKEYVEAILEDQKERGLMMFLADNLVLAHSAIEKGVNHLDVAMATFKTPVVFLNGKTARIIIVLAAEDQVKHMRILNDILNIFSKRKRIEQLLALSDHEKIHTYITKVILTLD